MIPDFVNYNFKKGTDWEIRIAASYAGFVGFCDAKMINNPNRKISAEVIVEAEQVLVKFPYSITTDALVGDYIFDVELNSGDLGDPYSQSFDTFTIGRGKIRVTL
ncbi:MAG: hypothetical protein SH817_08635 [Leptospira sp.]|nr:hypothetical protein [Leptospira sp.]